MIKYYKNIAQNFLTILPYVGEFNLLNFYSSMKGHPLRDKEKHKRLKKRMIKHIEEGLIADAKVCYHLKFDREVPRLGNIQKHFRSLFRVYYDYNKILKRRIDKDFKTNSERDYPKYFNRNFHFQTDGYTSEYSASLYDHQVEILFAGMAGPMRRLILEEIKDYSNGEILEMACGTGSTTEIVSRFLPNAKITATDLSYEYIEYAKVNRILDNVIYQQLDALSLTKHYDCIYNVFLLHELPMKERGKVLEKQLEQLSPGGKGIVIESLQLGDLDFLDEVLYDFPKYYHEPFYKNYIEHPVEDMLKSLGAKNIKITKRLFSKCISFSK